MYPSLPSPQMPPSEAGLGCCLRDDELPPSKAGFGAAQASEAMYLSLPLPQMPPSEAAWVVVVVGAAVCRGLGIVDARTALQRVEAYRSLPLLGANVGPAWQASAARALPW